MKRIIPLLIGILICCNSGFAQDLITKTTGEDIKAKVLEVDQTEVRYKRYDNPEGPIFTLQKAEILMIRYENGTKDIFNTRTESNTVSSKPKYKSFSSPKRTEASNLWQGNGEGMTPGSYFSTDIGFYASAGDYGRSRIGINAIYTYQLNPFFGFGFGTGFRAFTDEDIVLMPFYANIKGYLLDNEISPYLSFNLGYSADISGSGQSGLNVAPKFGVTKRLSNKSMVYFEIGYEMQTLEFYIDYSGSRYYSNENSGAISFNVGYTF